jgi:glycoside/pentoside/hexuronide:cation symporter, GPH family
VSGAQPDAKGASVTQMTDVTAQTGEPSAKTLLAYALPALPLAVLTLPFYVLVPEFYSREMGLPIATVGAVLLAVRLLDAISDPIAGMLADRFRPSFGRRRTWVLASSPLVALSATALFVPPENPGALYLLIWASLLSLAWTGCLVPHQAWGVELSRTYSGRTRVSAFRESFTVVGILLALVVPALMPMFGYTNSRAGLAALAVMVGIGLPLAVIVSVWLAPEPVERTSAHVSFRAGMATLLANRPFARLLGAFFINGLANGLPASLFLFYVADRLGARDAAGPLLVLYFVCGVLGVPIWLALSRRIGKHRAWAVGMMLAAVTFGAAVFLVEGQVAAFAVVCVLTGLALGADIVLPAAMQGDVIDIDVAATGAERSGLYLGLWALATKLALALAVGIAFPVLAWSGFDPSAGISTKDGLLALAILYAGVPVVLKLIAIAMIWTFPLAAPTAAKAI